MAIKILDDVSVQGGLSISGSISATNISSSVNYVQSPKTVVNSISGISQILVMNQTSYDTLSPKLSSVLYVIV
jgi:hypothetical protein